MKTRNYLVLMVALILVPALISATWGLYLLLQKEREARVHLVEARAAAIALDIDQEIASVEGMLHVLANTDYIQTDNFSSFYNLLTEVNKGGDSSIGLYSSDGKVLLHTQRPFGTNLSDVIYDWIPAAIAQHKVTISDLRLGKIAHAPVVSVNVPIMTRTGKEYLLSQVIQPDHLTKLLRTHTYPNSWVVGIIGSDGVSIARNKNEAAFVGKTVTPDLLHAMQGQARGQLKNVSREGLLLHTIFTRTDRTQWTVAIGVPEAEIDAPAKRAVLYGVATLILIFGIGALAVFVLARRMTNAFSEAATAADLLGNGRVPKKPPSNVQEADVLNSALYHAGTKLATERANREVLEQELALHLAKEQEARTLAESQNAAKDEFLAMLAHELRNPLAPISAAAQLLKIAGPDNKMVKRTSDIIGRQVDHLSALIDDLLDVSRITRGLAELEMENVDIRSVVTDAVEQVRPLVESRKHVLNIRLDMGHAWVIGNKTRLIQAVTNLLNNAAKYTPQAGDILLAVDVETDWVRISVTDNGMGMEPSLLPHVFELFRQGKRTPDRSQGGLGLGLALVKSIVTLHDGRVEAHSDGLDKGSTFEILLPIDRTAENQITDVEKPSVVSRSAKPVSIMVVDDNEDAAHTLASLLQEKGHQVQVEVNAQHALTTAADVTFQLFILDIGLPDLDGYELVRRLRAQPENEKSVMVALTGYGQAHDKILSKQAGFDFHFLKPLAIAELDKILHMINERATPTK